MSINSSSWISSCPFSASITKFCKNCRISFCFACSNRRSSSCESSRSPRLSIVGLPQIIPTDSQNVLVVMRYSSRPCSTKLHLVLVVGTSVGFLHALGARYSTGIGVFATVFDNTPLHLEGVQDSSTNDCIPKLLLTCRVSCNQGCR